MISVIVPAYNEEERIAGCLEALAAQETLHPFEVILVDNGSTDNTVSIAQRFKKRMNLQIVIEPQKGRGRARRKGWAIAKGDLLLSTDADTVVPRQWIQTYIDLFKKYPAVVGISGNSVVHDCSRVLNVILNILQPIATRTMEFFFGFPCLNGFNCGVRAWAYHASGGFRTDLDAQEDFELSKRVMQFGDMKYTLRACVCMSGRRFRHGFVRGVLDYPKTYIQKFWMKKEWVPLEDVR